MHDYITRKRCEGYGCTQISQLIYQYNGKSEARTGIQECQQMARVCVSDLHDEGGVLVRFLREGVQLRDRVVESLQKQSANRFINSSVGMIDKSVSLSVSPSVGNSMV